MKPGWIIAIIITIIAGIGVYVVRFGTHAKRLFVDVGTIKPIGVSGMTDLLGGFQLSVPVILKNFSPSGFNVNQMKIDLYTTTDNGTKLASQPEPLQEPKHLPPNENSTINMSFDANLNGFLDLLINQIDEVDSWSDAKDRIMSWITTGELGVTIRAKGFVQAEGVKVNVDEDVQI